MSGMEDTREDNPSMHLWTRGDVWEVNIPHDERAKTHGYHEQRRAQKEVENPPKILDGRSPEEGAPMLSSSLLVELVFLTRFDLTDCLKLLAHDRKALVFTRKHLSRRIHGQ